MKRARDAAVVLRVSSDVAQLVLEFTAPVCALARPHDGLPHAELYSCAGCEGVLCRKCERMGYECDVCSKDLCLLCTNGHLCGCGAKLTVCTRCRGWLTSVCCGDDATFCVPCLAQVGPCASCGRGRCADCQDQTCCSGALR